MIARALALGILMVATGCAAAPAQEDAEADEGALVEGASAPTFRAVPMTGDTWLANQAEVGVYKEADGSIVALVDSTRHAMSFTLTLGTSGLPCTYAPALGEIATLEPITVRSGRATIAGTRATGERFRIAFDMRMGKTTTLSAEIDGQARDLDAVDPAAHGDINAVLTKREGTTMARVFGLPGDDRRLSTQYLVLAPRGGAPRVYMLGGVLKSLDRLDLSTSTGAITVRGTAPSGKPVVTQVTYSETDREIEYAIQ